MCGPLPKTLTLFMTWPNIWYPFYDRCVWHKVSLNIFCEWLLLMVLSIMMKKYLRLKTYPVQDKGSKTTPKWPKSILCLWRKRLKNVGAAHTYTIAHIRETPEEDGANITDLAVSGNGTEMKEARQPVGNIHLLPRYMCRLQQLLS